MTTEQILEYQKLIGGCEKFRKNKEIVMQQSMTLYKFAIEHVCKNEIDAKNLRNYTLVIDGILKGKNFDYLPLKVFFAYHSELIKKFELFQLEKISSQSSSEVEFSYPRFLILCDTLKRIGRESVERRIKLTLYLKEHLYKTKKELDIINKYEAIFERVMDGAVINPKDAKFFIESHAKMFYDAIKYSEKSGIKLYID